MPNQQVAGPPPSVLPQLVAHTREGVALAEDHVERLRRPFPGARFVFERDQLAMADIYATLTECFIPQVSIWAAMELPDELRELLKEFALLTARERELLEEGFALAAQIREKWKWRMPKAA